MFVKQMRSFTMLNQFIIAAIILIAQHENAAAYTSMSKENIFADVFLTELLNRMDKEIDPVSGNNYFDLDGDMPKSVDLVSRSSKNNMPDDFEYRSMFGSASHPSIRDQEYMQHSSLWGHQYVSGGMGEAPNRYNTIVKTDASLPAYCNPPNPCPHGYKENQGCISNFENTAIFSREFQAAQECTCDTEHMFDCVGQDNSGGEGEMTSTMEKFLMHQFQNDNDIDNSNGVVKKFYGFDKKHHHQQPLQQQQQEQQLQFKNPFLEGEKLPIAAKKGDHIQI